MLIHGTGSSSRCWWRVGPALGRAGWRVTAVDLRAHGDSPPAHAALQPEELAADLAQTLAPMRTNLLIGHSLGAVAALALAAARPDAATMLVLEEPPGPDTVDFETAAAGIETAATTARADSARALAELAANTPRWDGTDRRTAIEDLLRCDAQMAAATLRAGGVGRATELAGQIAAPVLTLLAPDSAGRYEGELDRSSVRGADRRRLLEAIHNGRHAIIDGGHCLHRDDPDGWLRAVGDFAAECLVEPVR